MALNEAYDHESQKRGFFTIECNLGVKEERYRFKFNFLKRAMKSTH